MYSTHYPPHAILQLKLTGLVTKQQCKHQHIVYFSVKKVDFQEVIKINNARNYREPNYAGEGVCFFIFFYQVLFLFY